MKKYLLLLLSFIVVTTAISQTWQWGKRVGSNWILPNSAEEMPVDMATDKNGNVYIVSSVYPNALLTIDTSYIPGLFPSNATNILLHSYDCEGNFRWSKIIGTGPGAYSKSVQTDTLGGVYLLAKFFANGIPIYIDSDTSFTDGNKQLYLIKFDTTGNLEWLNSPLSDTVSFNNAFFNANPIDMHVDPAGNITLFAEMPIGDNLNGELTLTSEESFALKYDRFGTYISATPLPFKIVGLKATYRLSCNATVAPNGNFIIAGYRFHVPQDTLIVGSDTLKKRAFIIVTLPHGQLLWYKQIDVSDPAFLPYSNSIFRGRPATDEAGNIFVSGVAQPNDTLDGFVFINTAIPVGSAMPLIVKYSASGNLLWAKVGSNTSGGLFSGISYINNKVASTGTYTASNLYFPGSSLSLGQLLNEGRDPLLAVFDAQSGDLISLDSLSGPFGVNEAGYVTTSDSKGNFFIAGSFKSNLDINGDILQAFGDNDIFIAKFGKADCNFSSPMYVSTLADKPDIVLYPNPTDGFVQLHISLKSDVTLWGSIYTVYDFTGKSVLTGKINSEDTLIELGNLSRGIYLIRVGEDLNHTFKVIRK